MRPNRGSDPVAYTTNLVIRTLARRIQGLNKEIRTIDKTLDGLITQTAPRLLDLHGVGVDTAASLLVTAGDNPDPISSERSWAHLCGTTPLPASSGNKCRYLRWFGAAQSDSRTRVDWPTSMRCPSGSRM